MKKLAGTYRVTAAIKRKWAEDRLKDIEDIHYILIQIKANLKDWSAESLLQEAENIIDDKPSALFDAICGLASKKYYLE